MNEEHFTDEVSYFFMTHILYIYMHASNQKLFRHLAILTYINELVSYTH